MKVAKACFTFVSAFMFSWAAMALGGQWLFHFGAEGKSMLQFMTGTIAAVLAGICTAELSK